MPIPSQSDFEYARLQADIKNAQPIRLVQGGPGVFSIARGVAIGVFVGMWLFAITFWIFAKSRIEASMNAPASSSYSYPR